MKSHDANFVHSRNIDDDADKEDIAFLKISDESMLKEYDLEPLPAIVYFREKFPQIYPGSDLTKEEAVSPQFALLSAFSNSMRRKVIICDESYTFQILDWVLKLKKAPRDVIVEVDRRTLRMLLDELDSVAIFFCRHLQATLE